LPAKVQKNSQFSVLNSQLFYIFALIRARRYSVSAKKKKGVSLFCSQLFVSLQTKLTENDEETPNLCDDTVIDSLQHAAER
jgi:hypothetical protein